MARLLAAFGIVLFHSGAPGGQFGYAALPFFLMVMLMLGLPGATRQPFARFAADRAKRLLQPWLIWSAIYGAFKLTDLLAHHESFGDEFSLSMVLTGPAIHLWFLPFAFLACLTLPGVARLYPQNDAQSRGVQPPPAEGWRKDRMVLQGLLLVVVLEGLAFLQGPLLPVPFAQWSFALPSVFAGIALGLSYSGLSFLGGPRRIGLLSVGMLAVGAVAWAMGWTAGLFQLDLAYAAVVLCLMLPTAPTAFSRFCGPASMSVYLVSPLMSSILERATRLAHSSPSLAFLTMAMAFVFVGLQYNLMARKRLSTA